MARVPRNVVAVTPGGSITKDMILGYYALFTVPDEPVSAATLRRLWNMEGLPENLVPKNRRAVNAFQVACRSVETRRHTNGSSKQAEVKVDEVIETPDECVYQITRLVRDDAQRVIEHPKAMRLTFDKASEEIKTERLEREAYNALKELDQDIRDHFERNAKRVPGSKVRAAIRALLDEMGATNVRRGSGGVYFCPREGKGTLDDLGTVLDGLYKDKAELHLIPCANDEGQRAMVERHLTANVSDELNELMAECVERLKTDSGVRSDRLNNIINRRRALNDHAEKYRAILDTSLGTVDEQMRLLDEQVEALMTKAGSSL